jgi:hypothetical protein
VSTVRFTIEVDMSPEAIAARLRDLGQLYALAMSLQSVLKLDSKQNAR